MRPSAKLWSWRFESRNTPRFELSQKLPRWSSASANTVSSYKPAATPKMVNLPFRKRFNPPPLVPIQSVPSGSPEIERMTSLPSPFLVV
jgi:hypothetical protein